MIKTVQFIKENGLRELVDTFRIRATRHQDYPNLVHLKYNQIESPMDSEIVQECRGLILDEASDWSIIAYPYRKFFNYGESHAIELDWESATVYEKVDGSLMYLYWYDGKWNVSSSGMPDAAGPCGMASSSFAEVFWSVWRDLGYELPNDTYNTYCFELMTPLNRVVVPVSESRIVFHGCRNMHTLSEINPSYYANLCGWEVVNTFPLSSLADIVQAADSLDPMEQEGFVVCDRNFNRIKVKSPHYVALLHTKETMTPRHMLDIVRRNQSEEFLNYFPDYRSLYEVVLERYNIFCSQLESEWNKNKHIVEQKDFAMAVKDKPGSSVLFGLRNGKYKSIKDGVLGMSLRTLERVVLAGIDVTQCMLGASCASK